MSSPRPSSSEEVTTHSAGGKRKEPSGDSQKEEAPQVKHSKGSIMEDFPVDSPNPFEEEFCGSDAVLLVEGRNLHVHKQFLGLHCSYFRVRLGSKDFAEASLSEIELNGDDFVKLTYNMMETFLRHIYPVHSFDPIKDDTMLEEMFFLSDYFQCQHVRTKCEAYLQQRVDLLMPSRYVRYSDPSACLYLWLCKKYGVTKFVEQFLQCMSKTHTKEFEENKYFKALSYETKNYVYFRRVKYLEN